MLSRLSIRNVALIDQLDMTFHDGFSVLTGETGAGKSIIIEAFNFVLGERANRELIQSGAEKASVEATFLVSPNDAVNATLAAMELAPEDGALVLSRELSVSGKGVCRANGTLISVAMLKEIGDALVDIHGQHAHQALLNPRLHLPMLDAFSGEAVLALKKRVAAAYHRASKAEKELRSAQIDERERQRRTDLLTYEMQEIDDAKLADGEEETLNEQRQLLQNAQSVMGALEASCETLSGDERVLSELSGVQRALDGIAPYRKDYADAAERLREAYYSIEDLAYTLRDFRNDFSFDPEMLNEAEARLEQIAALKRKYGADIAEILSYREGIGKEFALLSTSEERRETLKRTYDAALSEYQALATELTGLRKAAAERFSAELLPELADLGMQNASFSVSFSRLSGELPGASGVDDAEFLLSTNRGEPEKPLVKVASGGELSRIMLSFKSVLAETDSIATMVFDEIDTGISGQIGTAVAVKMREIAARHQVLCITHLPQIAAYAQHQYLVYKETAGARTRSDAVLLTEERRVSEIARIMGGNDDEVALEHARRLIETAERNMSQITKA